MSRLLIFALTACAHPRDIAGWEGFHAPTAIDGEWLDRRGIDIDPEVIARAARRVVKLVLADGVRELPEGDLRRMHARYCTAEARTWNNARCDAIEAGRCDGDICTYQHYGSCSGFLAGDRTLLTAAHCLAKVTADPELAQRSHVLLPNSQTNYRLGPARLRKTDFAHGFVSIEEPDPIDVATIEIDGKLAPWPIGDPPSDGDTLMMIGYPRVDGRSAEAMRRHGYRAVPGMIAVSFGRMADRNERGDPFCSVQEGYDPNLRAVVVPIRALWKENAATSRR